MTNGNEGAFPIFDKYNSVEQYGLSKLEYFAAKDNTPLPDSFAHTKLKEFNKRTKQSRSTVGSAFELMNFEERAETRMAWKVLCAKKLIAELNKH